MHRYFSDPLIRSLKLDEPDCKDDNLLFALIYTRYSPYFLTVGYEGGRSIERSTVEYAKMIHSNFAPYTMEKGKPKDFKVIVTDKHVMDELAKGNNKYVELKSSTYDLPKCSLHIFPAHAENPLCFARTQLHLRQKK